MKNKVAASVVSRYLRASRMDTVTGGEREDYLDAVWQMFLETYRSLGYVHSRPEELLQDYSHWALAFNAEGTPVAFHVMKQTMFGFKSGLGGSDGSPEGKGQVKQILAHAYSSGGAYAEVSHRVEDLALAARAPVVCASYVPMVLGKSVTPSEDGLHYTRNLVGVGMVRKLLVGRPKGVPTTKYDSPSCPPVESSARAASVETGDDYASLVSHVACFIET